MAFPQRIWRFVSPVERLAEEAAQWIAAEIAAMERPATVVLAGGSSPRLLYRKLAEKVDSWQGLVVIPGDERCVAPGHPARNDRMIREALLGRIQTVPPAFIPIPAERGPQIAAAEFESVLRTLPPLRLALLGLGEDGHTASLFPGNVWPADAWTAGVQNAPKAPPLRVSLTPAYLNQAQTVIFYAPGEKKKRALRALREYENIPAACISARETLWILTDVRI
jgi:6-phosphogluconolactonase